MTCTLSPDPASGFYLERLRCSSRAHADGDEDAPWPLLPLQCWTYILVSLAPRVINLGNACRAVYDVQRDGGRSDGATPPPGVPESAHVQRDGMRDAQLQVIEQALVLTLWLGAVCQDKVGPAAALVVCAACAELLLLVTEPLRRLHRELEIRGTVATPLIEIPIDVSYAEKRWQRLLMIALAMLPNFRALLDGADADDGLIGLVRVGFMVVSCTLAYIIKVYYFDLVDEFDMMEDVRRRSPTAEDAVRKANLHKVQHALKAHQEGKAPRWKASLWIATHVVLIVAVCATGNAINKLLTPWDGYPLTDLWTALRARFLIAVPITTILWILCVQQSMHQGAGSGSRAIGRTKRLALRGVTGLLLLLLPLLTYATSGPVGSSQTCEAAATNMSSSVPPWESFPHPASRAAFLCLLFLLLLAQLSMEVYGRNVYHRGEGPGAEGAGDAVAAGVGGSGGGAQRVASPRSPAAAPYVREIAVERCDGV